MDDALRRAEGYRKAGAGLLISVSIHRDVEIPRWHG